MVSKITKWGAILKMDFEIRDDGKINIVMTDYEREWINYYLGDCAHGDGYGPTDIVSNEVENRAQDLRLRKDNLGVRKDVVACEMRQRIMAILCDAGIAHYQKFKHEKEFIEEEL